ncbi:MAG TPA: RNB domain-containing ribonuclease [Intrasporangiaceae bacterium]|nr:RNB domain-containing ribonuclease [Intrasporangiaceae bacterium]
MPTRHISAQTSGREPLDVTDALRQRFAQIREEFDVPTEFPSDVLAEARAAAASDQLDLPERDETAIPFITIDPPGSMDLDQAIHIEEDGDGFRVRYAITDLPVYVTPGGAIDREARGRGLTIYSPDQRTPLHPTELSEGVASLLPDQVCPAFVWDMRLGPDGAVGAATVYRAMVRSVERTDYQSVQDAVDNGTAEGTAALLARVGPLRIERELTRGGASLPMPEQVVAREADGTYTVRFRPPLAAEEWNAQISLLTGMVAAEIMLHHKVGILRTLPPPAKGTVARFRRSAAAAGVPWEKGVSYGAFLRTLNREDPAHLGLIFEATTLFRGSGYTVVDGAEPDQAVHAAVAKPYAHVTAPLRRLVDRFGLVICAALEAGEDVPEWVMEALPTLPEIMSEAGRRAGGVERASADAVEAAVLQDKVGEIFDVIVVDRAGNGKKGDLVVKLLDPAVITRAGGEAEVGDTVDAELTEASVERSTVRFEVTSHEQFHGSDQASG